MKHPQKSQLISSYIPGKKHICTDMLTLLYMHTRVHTYIHTETHTDKQPKHIYTQIHLHTRLYASAETYIITYRCTHIYPHIETHPHTESYMNQYTQIHAHTTHTPTNTQLKPAFTHCLTAVNTNPFRWPLLGSRGEVAISKRRIGKDQLSWFRTHVVPLFFKHIVKQ